MTGRIRVDPFDCTNYHRTDDELEAFLLQCIFVAGKRADTVSTKVNRMFSDYPNNSPFGILRLWIHDLEGLLRKYKFGRYKVLSECMKILAADPPDLRSCTSEDLEALPGVGPKTSRYFLLHSRKGIQIACLDTHVLRFMREELGINTPKSTPSGTLYARLERQFLEHVGSTGKSVAEYDLELWTRYTKSTKDR